ncbi:hypothetical protein K523DRAFT_416895 [Schizophyllum commune Tattone D]|nr:hypothetical protein K523DRAFT_416895 [Schizophyllum commune Tattone D]
MKYKSMLLPKDPLLALPTELVCQILEYLDVSDLLACSLVTRHMRRVILHSAPLQYSIELAKSRMASTPSASALSTASRLNMLRTREQAWRGLRWSARHRITLPPTGPIYEFIGGIYGNGQEDENRVTSTISFFELPTQVKGRTMPAHPRVWTHPMGTLSIVDFTLDPTHDLLALVASASPPSNYLYEIHLRSLSTNEPHPMAQQPILSCLKRPNGNNMVFESAGAVRIQVSGDQIALLLRQTPGMGSHLNIWNWKRGADRHISFSVTDGIEDFTFLSDKAFLLVRPKGSFETYSFDLDLPHTPPTPLHPGTHTSTTPSGDPELRATYLFPPLNTHHTYWYITMSSNPSAGYRPAADAPHTTSPSAHPPWKSASSSAKQDVPPQQAPAFEQIPIDDLSSPFIIPPSESGPFTIPPSESNPFPPSDSTPFTRPPSPTPADEAASRSYYPRPDDRIHSCCVYTTSLFPVLEALAPNQAAAQAIAAGNINLPAGAAGNANAGGAGQANANVNGVAAPAPEPPGAHRQHVHSFVFFVNLRFFLRDLQNMDAERERELAEARAREEWERQAMARARAAEAEKRRVQEKKRKRAQEEKRRHAEEVGRRQGVEATRNMDMDAGRMEVDASQRQVRVSRQGSEEKRSTVRGSRERADRIHAQRVVRAERQKARRQQMEVADGLASSSVANGLASSSALRAGSPMREESPSSTVAEASTSRPSSSMSARAPSSSALAQAPLSSRSRALLRPPTPPWMSTAQWTPSPTPATATSAVPAIGPSAAIDPLAMLADVAVASTSTEPSSVTAADPPSPFLTSTGTHTTPAYPMHWPVNPPAPQPFTWPIQPSLPPPTLPTMPQALFATMPQTLLPQSQSFHTAPATLHPVPPVLPSLASLPSTTFGQTHNSIHLPPPQAHTHVQPVGPVMLPPAFAPAPAHGLPPPHLLTLRPLSVPAARRRRPRVHAWSSWGPPNTRWFRECLSTDWQHAIYGLRAIDSVRIQPVTNGPAFPDPATFALEDHATPPSLRMRGLEIVPPDGEDDLAVLQGLEQPRKQRHLRLRDFNPYFVNHPELAEGDWGLDVLAGDDKSRPRWRAARVVKDPSYTSSRGVFREDVRSELPYVEVISEEAFDVTDVMMDDCRILLLTIQGQRGGLNKLKGIDVLTM